ncbi:unnamed protein product [Spodoptera exigua]|nr:unnamed protein product [Spodoptera exigua]
MLRPNQLEDLSLAEFAVRYETVSSTIWSEDDGDAELREEDNITTVRYIKLLDNTRMRVRNRPAVLRTRYYTINSDKEAYYYSLIVCHIPFRNENELLLENESAEDCFVRRQRDLRPLLGNISAEQFAHAEQIIQQALAQVTALNAARETHVNNAPVLCAGEQIVNRDETFCEDMGERALMSDELFLSSIRGLNIQQRNLFQKVSLAIENDLHGQESQLLLFITGGAGSGKSFLLKLIVEHIKRCYAPTVDTLLKPNFVERDDTEFIELLNSLRVGELTTAQLELLCERRHVPLNGEFANGVAVRIFPTVRQVDDYNDKMSTENAKLHRTYQINAVDESREVATYGRKPPDNVIPKDVNNCGGFLCSIKIGVGSRVMLRRNIAVSEGLVNGAMGIIKKIKWPALRRDQLEEGELPEAVYIKFDDDTIAVRLKDRDGCIPIPPSSTTFQAKRGYGDVERRMLPLILSWAVTVHKLQGTTLDRAVIDLGKKNFAKGQMYVALSRVRSLEGIVLSDLDANKLLNRPHDDRAMTEITRLRNLPSDNQGNT